MKYFIVGYMFLFIYRPFEIYSILETIHLERLYMIATLLYYFFSGAVQKYRAYGALALGLFVSAMFLSVTGAYDVSRWWIVVENYLKVVVFYFVLATSINDKDDLIEILYAYVVIMFVYEGKSLYEYLFNNRVQFRMGVSRMIGVDQSGADPNALAATINYSLPFAYALFLRYKDDLNYLWHKRVLVAYVLLSTLCIFLTGSRAGAVIFVFFAVFVWLYSPHKVRWLLVLTFAAVIIWQLLPYEKKIRLESIWNEDVVMEGVEGEKIMRSAKESTNGRTEGLWDGIQLLQRHPLTGAGAGNFSKARQLVREIPLGSELQAHNLYGQLMGELGVFGIVSFLVFLISIIKLNVAVIRNKCSEMHPIAWACIITIVLLLINGMAGHNLYRYTWLWVAAFSSIQYGISIEQSKKSMVATE